MLGGIGSSTDDKCTMWAHALVLDNGQHPLLLVQHEHCAVLHSCEAGMAWHRTCVRVCGMCGVCACVRVCVCGGDEVGG